MELKGKRVFITGAAKRLGRELAIHLSDAGCLVTVHFNQSKKEAEELKKKIQCNLFQADFSTAKIERTLERLQEEGIDADILINNGSSFRRREWKDVDEAFWDSELSVNLKAPFFLCQYFGSRMKKRGFGKIINMADIAAQRAYLPYLPYSLAKSGVIAMTSALARAFAPEVQVNAIAPGTILFVDEMTEEDRKKILKKIPAGRTGTVKEFLNTVDFLLSDVDYITGQTILLDGGRSLNW
jgi:NAD(P)-dependent dehydrogenase (short-subunit alcohol dehydrogenase family)